MRPHQVNIFLALSFLLALAATTPTWAQDAGQKAKLHAWAVRNGHLVTLDANGQAWPAGLEADINTVEDGGPVRLWFLADDQGEGIPTLYLCDADGNPLDAVRREERIQDVSFSPGGQRFVVASGSDIRPDLFYTVYAAPQGGQPAKALSEDLGGLRGSGRWIDDYRLAWTSIDGNTRERTLRAWVTACGFRQ